MAHRARLPHRCRGGGRADRAASGLAPSDGSRARGAASGAAAVVRAAAHRAQHVWAVRCARRRARPLGAGARHGPRRRRHTCCTRCSSTLRPSRAPARRRAPTLNVPHPFPSARVAKKAGAFSAVTLPVRRALGARRLIPRAPCSPSSSASRSSPRAPLSAAAAPRAAGKRWRRPCSKASPLSPSPYSTRRRREPPRCGHIFSAREWAAANEYVRLDDDGRRGVAAAVATAAADVGAAVRRWLAPSAEGRRVMRRSAPSMWQCSSRGRCSRGRRRRRRSRRASSRRLSSFVAGSLHT